MACRYACMLYMSRIANRLFLISCNGQLCPIKACAYYMRGTRAGGRAGLAAGGEMFASERARPIDWYRHPKARGGGVGKRAYAIMLLKARRVMSMPAIIAVSSFFSWPAAYLVSVAW